MTGGGTTGAVTLTADVTAVNAGAGLTESVTGGAVTLSANVTGITAGAGLTGSTTSGDTTLSVTPATTAQVQAGSDNIDAITSAALAGAMAGHLVGNGYQKLPNGFIIQWGTGTTSTGNGDTVVFPTAFPNACFSVVVNELNANNWAPYGPALFGSSQAYLTTSTFAVYSWVLGSPGGYAGSRGFQWIAIGH